MDKQHIVVTYNASPEEKALFLEVLGSDASLTFLNEIAPAQREQALAHANILLSWNFPREIPPQDYPSLQHMTPYELQATYVEKQGPAWATARLPRLALVFLRIIFFFFGN